MQLMINAAVLFDGTTTNLHVHATTRTVAMTLQGKPIIGGSMKTSEHKKVDQFQESAQIAHAS